MSDPISAMLTKIRNAQMAGHKEVTVSASKLKMALAQILEKEGFVESVAKEAGDSHEILRIKLKYYQKSGTEKLPAIQGIKRVSREGQRIYIKKKTIRPVKNTYGIGIISTSRGVMTDAQSKKMGLGGEYICEVW
jgi:small subunit ribosomal protein S8